MKCVSVLSISCMEGGIQIKLIIIIKDNFGLLIKCEIVQPFKLIKTFRKTTSNISVLLEFRFKSMAQSVDKHLACIG